MPKLKLSNVTFSQTTADYHFISSMDALFVQKSDVVGFILKQETMLFGEGYKI